ncbi:hypothetical protein HYX07_04920 [Candidatus Woesearchaeota archaeon]|nr:hypothetical protein [Candidatus Woesearchaeota archaeon]
MVMRSKKFLNIVLICVFALILNSLFVAAAAPVLDLIGGKQVDEGSLLEFTVTASDADNDTLTFSKNDSRGDLNQNTGQYSWAPGFSEAGIYFVQFSVSDGAESASEIIMVNATEVGNHAPILNLIGGKQVLEGQLLEFTISASDPDSDALAYSTNASLGILDSAGKFSWQTDFDDAGIYFVLFSASDAAETASEIIMVNATEAGNHAPQVSVIEPSGLSVSGNASVSWSASDQDNDALEFSAYVAGRIYDNGILMGENRTKVCATALSNCVFDSTMFANGNYTVIVLANDSMNYTEGYSNDFMISNSQENEVSAQAETQETQNANSDSQNNVQRSRTSGNGVPPPFWWLINTSAEQGNVPDVNEQLQGIEDVKLQDANIENQSAQSSALLPKQPEESAIPSAGSGSKFYMFAWLALLVLIVPIAYIPYRTLSRDKIARLQASVKKKFQNAAIKMGNLHKGAMRAYGRFW